MIRLTAHASVVKQHDRSRRPPDAYVEIMSHHYVVEQELRQHFKLGLLKSDDFSQKLAVYEQTSLAGNGVHAHQRMDRVNGVLSVAPANGLDVGNHLGRCVKGHEVVQEGPDRGRKAAEQKID
jgi:hypothetical protein